MKATFPLGQVVATPAALAACEEAGLSPLRLLARHASGDWGDLGGEDLRSNDAGLAHGMRIFSSYAGPPKVWIITEADRSSTCILLPEDY